MICEQSGLQTTGSRSIPVVKPRGQTCGWDPEQASCGSQLLTLTLTPVWCAVLRCAGQWSPAAGSAYRPGALPVPNAATLYPIYLIRTTGSSLHSGGCPVMCMCTDQCWLLQDDARSSPCRAVPPRPSLSFVIPPARPVDRTSCVPVGRAKSRRRYRV